MIVQRVKNTRSKLFVRDKLFVKRNFSLITKKILFQVSAKSSLFSSDDEPTQVLFFGLELP